MCDQTGINLTRLISNNKAVLQLIPESKRKWGVKSRQLLSFIFNFYILTYLMKKFQCLMECQKLYFEICVHHQGAFINQKKHVVSLKLNL